MMLTIEIIASYLGKDASVFLAEPPFVNWTYKRSVENDLERPLVDYIFSKDGMDFVCDSQDKVNSIFLYSDGSRCFKEDIQDFSLTSTRQEVIARLGSPSKSGGRLSDPILGEYGAWDRFARTGFAIHVEYRPNVDVVNKVTFMRADVVP